VERLKTKINIGEKYLTRKGVKVEVMIKHTENDYEVKDIEGQSFQTFNSYIVTSYGGFGNTPNQYDLIKKL
jgi:hypothetical protein